MPVPLLKTPRLTLRPLTFDDIDASVAGVGNYEVAKWLSVVPYPYDTDDARSFIGDVTEGDRQVWGIEDRTGLIGVVGVEGELGYWLARPAWRKGYAFEAAHAVVSHWFDASDAVELGSGYFHGNDRSGSVLRALGFVETGVERRHAKALAQEVDLHAMRLTRAAWAARQEITLYTPRLTIRPLMSGDAPRLLQIATPTVTRGIASVGNGWSQSQMEDYIAVRRWQGRPGFMLGIEQEGRLIGAIGCGGTPVSLFYWLAEDVWGNGVASEAVSAVLPELFARFPLSTLEADHFEDNPASGTILRKHGFVEVGRSTGTSLGRVDPAPVVEYRLDRSNLRTPA